MGAWFEAVVINVTQDGSASKAVGEESAHSSKTTETKIANEDVIYHIKYEEYVNRPFNGLNPLIWTCYVILGIHFCLLFEY